MGMPLPTANSLAADADEATPVHALPVSCAVRVIQTSEAIQNEQFGPVAKALLLRGAGHGIVCDWVCRAGDVNQVTPEFLTK